MTFSNIIQDEKPVLIDFFATWCGPCKAMTPVLEQLADNIGDHARIIKIDIDKNPNLATKLGIKGVPTFILYKKGDQLWRESGMQSITELEKVIKVAMEK
jgi:thioredoxin 1